MKKPLPGTADPVATALIQRLNNVKLLSERWLMRRIGDADEGVTLARFNVMILLRDAGPQKMSEIAKAVGIAPRSVTTLVDCLERDGLARRTPHPTDRRATVIELTERGAGAIGSQSHPYTDATDLLMRALKPGEPELLLAVYERWEGVIHEDLRRMDEAV
ncbi:MAG: MarR family transcriptional regulator [Bauldia sp.]|nr:MarR family transcriptional regulator [Bauldia sp.]